MKVFLFVLVMSITSAYAGNNGQHLGGSFGGGSKKIRKPIKSRKPMVKVEASLVDSKTGKKYECFVMGERNNEVLFSCQKQL